VEEKPQQETTQIETTPDEMAPIIPETPEETEKKWIKPLILSVLGVLVATSLVFGGYKLTQIRQVQPQPTPTPVAVPTPTPEPTADWKIYTNTKYEYSIKYPKEWQVFEVKEGPEAGIRTDFAESESLSGREYWIWIKINNNPDGLSATKWVDRLLFQYSDQPAVMAGIKREKDRVADTEAERVTGLPAMTEMISVFIPEEKNIYEIVLQKGVGVLSNESKQAFNLMLSTFRFLEETEGWKTYMNSEYKFSFKYPSDYYLEDKFLKVLPEDANSFLGIILIKEKNKEIGQPPTINLSIVQTGKSSKEFLDYDHQRELTSWEGFEEERGFKVDKPYIISEENVQTGQVAALKVERQRMPTAPHSKETWYLVKKDNLLYIFSVDYGTYNPDTGEDGTDEKNTLETIFQTFKFIN